MSRVTLREKQEFTVISFRVSRDVESKLKKVAKTLPSLPGRKPVSIQQAARALMLVELNRR
jgi:hypothetical protein